MERKDHLSFLTHWEQIKQTARRSFEVRVGDVDDHGSAPHRTPAAESPDKTVTWALPDIKAGRFAMPTPGPEQGKLSTTTVPSSTPLCSPPPSAAFPYLDSIICQSSPCPARLATEAKQEKISAVTGKGTLRFMVLHGGVTPPSSSPSPNAGSPTPTDGLPGPGQPLHPPVQDTQGLRGERPGVASSCSTRRRTAWS